MKDVKTFKKPKKGRDGKVKGKGDKFFFKAAKKKYCRFCSDDAMPIDYKNVSMIRSFLTERAKMIPRRNSGNCAKHQRELTVAIKRARYLALVPYTTG